MTENKFKISILFLLGAIIFGLFTYNRFSKIPNFSDKIELQSNRIILIKRFQYTYNNPLPVKKQRVFLPSWSSNILSVTTKDGKVLSYTINDKELIIFFDKEIKQSTKLDYKIISEVNSFTPFFNIVRHTNNFYTLHYINWEKQPAIKSKTVILPKEARIAKVITTVPNMLMINNKVSVRGKFNKPKKFDLTVHFYMPDGLITNGIAFVQATPPLSTSSNITFRVSKKLYSHAPTIRGDFTSWCEVKMYEKGDMYIFTTNIPGGIYRYQIRYYYVPHNDCSVVNRQLSAHEDSMSIIRIAGRNSRKAISNHKRNL